MSLRARLTLFFVAIVVIPLLVAGLVIRTAIGREVDHRTDLRLKGEAQAFATARYAEQVSVAQLGRSAATSIAPALGAADASGQAPSDVLGPSLEDARLATGLDFLVFTPGPAAGSALPLPSIGPGRFLDPNLRFQAKTILQPGQRSPLLLFVDVPLDTGGVRAGTLRAGVYLDQQEGSALKRLSGGVDFEIAVDGRVVVTTLAQPVPLPSPSRRAFGLPGDRRGLFVRLPGAPAGPPAASIGVVAPLEGDVGSLQDAILIVLFASVVIATLLGYGMARMIANPIRRLADEAAAALRDDEAGPQRRSGDEVAALATSLTTITEHLQEAERLSMTDALTGIGNRRYLEMTLTREVERARRYGRGLSVLMVDVDRFKEINDRLGHDRGDRVLAAVAHRVETSVRREIDTVVRFGGEEFVALLPETDSEGAMAVAERIRRAVEGEPFGALLGDGLQVTVSVGVASFPQDGEGARELIRAADGAMYLAKRRGRNRVEPTDRRGEPAHRGPADEGRPGIDS